MRTPLLMLFILICVADTFGQKRSLQYFLDQGLANSPLLTDLQNQVTLNRLDSLLILAAQKPQVSFTSNNLYAPVYKGYGYDEAITNGAGVSALIGVSKTLLNTASNKVQFANIELLIRSLRNNIALTKQEIQKTIIYQYLITYGDMLQVNSGRIIQDMMNRQEAILKILTQKNVYKQVDYLSFLVTLKQNDLKVKQQVNQYKNDYATLHYLVGSTDTMQLPLEEPTISLNPLPGIQGSVFFQKYDLDSLTLINNKRLLDINYRPKLNVFADAGYNSSLAYAPYKNFGTSVGINFSIPIYNGKQKVLEYSKINVQEETRQASKKFYTRQYYQQINQLRQNLQALSALAEDINLQLKYIETLVTANEKLLQTGEVRVYDYIISLSSYLNVQSLINENKINRWQLISQINYWNR